MFSGHQPDLVWRGGLLGPQRGNSLTWRAQICHIRPGRIAARRLSQAALSARIAEFGRSGTRFKRAIRGQRLAPDGSTSRVRLQALTADLTRPGGRWAVSPAFCQARQSIMSQLERVAITADGSLSRSTPNREGKSTRPITGFRRVTFCPPPAFDGAGEDGSGLVETGVG